MKRTATEPRTIYQFDISIQRDVLNQYITESRCNLDRLIQSINQTATWAQQHYAIDYIKILAIDWHMEDDVRIEQRTLILYTKDLQEVNNWYKDYLNDLCKTYELMAQTKPVVKEPTAPQQTVSQNETVPIKREPILLNPEEKQQLEKARHQAYYRAHRNERRTYQQKYYATVAKPALDAQTAKERNAMNEVRRIKRKLNKQ